VFTGTNGKVSRNQGQGGFGGDCGPNGCTCEICIGKDLAPSRLGPARTPFVSSQAPGIVLSNVLNGRLSHFTVDSNARGGILLVPQDISAWSFTLDSSALRGPSVQLWADGYLDQTGSVAVHGSHFRYGDEGIEASYLGQLVIQGSTFDSVPNTANGSPAIGLSQIVQATLDADTLRGGLGSGIEGQNVAQLDLTNGLIRRRDTLYQFNPEAALGLGSSGAVTVRGMRIDSSTVRGIRLDSFQSGPFVIDSNSVTDIVSRPALQLSTAAQITRNFIARNTVGINILGGAETSPILHNNFVANVLMGVSNQGFAPVFADTNYWNDPLGPRCPLLCNPLSVGDTVGSNVTFGGFLLGLVPGVPALVQPIRTSARPRQQVKREGQP
jgi:hypothetical protein